MSENWETDFRWRQVHVSNSLLGQLMSSVLQLQTYTTNAPADLVVIGLTEVQTGPAGRCTFVVWSASFEPAPNDGDRVAHPIPFFEIEFRS